eukprot:gene4275-5262_t
MSLQGSFVVRESGASEPSVAGAAEGFTDEEVFGQQNTHYSGWLLKRYDGGTDTHGSSTYANNEQKYKRRYFYLLDDRLCYTRTEGPSGGVVKYLPLDRIPVRAYPRGYKPKLAISLLEHSLLGGKKYKGSCFSVQCGDTVHFFAADSPELARRSASSPILSPAMLRPPDLCVAADVRVVRIAVEVRVDRASLRDPGGSSCRWVESLNEVWMKCISKSRRSVTINSKEEKMFHSEQVLRAEIVRLNELLAKAHTKLQGKVVRLEKQLEDRITYTILVYTGDKVGAGTSAEIFIELYGEGGDSTGERKLKLDADQVLNRNTHAKFEIEAGNLGPLTKIRIGHDNSGPKPAWYLDKVRIRSERDRQKWMFLCSNWLAKEKGDRLLERELTVAKAEASAPTTSYAVTVYTSDKARPLRSAGAPDHFRGRLLVGAGTDANVNIILRGSSGESSKLVLTKGPGEFVRGGRDVFTVETEPVGALTEIVIGHDNHGEAPAWHLDQVEIKENAAGSKVMLFPCKQWLDSATGDRRTVRVLQRDAQLADVVRYILNVDTGDHPGAGTSCAVTAELKGEWGSSGPTLLTNSRLDFQRNAKDVFYLECAQLGPLHSLTIGHDNKGNNRDWFLNEVVVVHEPTQARAYFSCDGWIGGGDGEGPVMRELRPSAESVHASKRKYTLVIKTSDLRAAGTDANVKVNLTGAKGSTGEIPLPAERAFYEKGNSDTIAITGKDVGDLQKLWIGHDNTGDGPGWHLAEVRVTVEGSAKETLFPCQRWLDVGEEDRKTSVELLAVHSRSLPTPLIDFKVSVHTSDLRGAGTDANVSVTLMGEKGVIGPNKLEAKRSDFERGQCDVFSIKARDVGPLQKLQIGHDNSGPAPSWHLAKVEVAQANGPALLFPCGRWLAKDADDGSTTRELLPASSGQMNVSKYAIKVVTSDIRFAGTDANVFICATGWERAEDGAQVDEFSVSMFDVGRMTSVDVWHSNTGEGAGWHLDYIEIFNESSTERVTVFTSNIRYAGTDSSVFIVLHGDRVPLRALGLGELLFLLELGSDGCGSCGVVFLLAVPESKRVQLMKGDNRDPFERGQSDTFMVDAEDVGQLTALSVISDGKGRGSDWHLARVEVEIVASGRKVYFKHQNWIKGAGTVKMNAEAYPPESSALCKYRIEVVTSDIRSAGTDASVMITMYGPNGDTGKLMLVSDSKEDLFERKQARASAEGCGSVSATAGSSLFDVMA